MKNTSNEKALNFMHLGLRSFVLHAVVALIYITTILALLSDWQSGGDNFRQGDWLINNSHDFVRRGFTGSLFLHMSDAFGLSPLTLVVSVQIFLLSLIFLAALSALKRLKDSDAFFLLAISPGFLSFEASNITALGMKEIFGLAAFAPLLAQAALPKYRYPATTTSLFLYACAAISHEVNLFLSPILILCILLLWNRSGFDDAFRRGGPEHRIGITSALKRVLPAYGASTPIMLFSVLFALAALVGLIYTIVHTKVADTAPICVPLVAKGLPPSICGGSISYLTHTFQQELRINVEAMLTYKGPVFLLSWFLAVFPLYYLSYVVLDDRNIFRLLQAAGLLFIPLFFVAIDWGRWIFTYFTSVFFCLSIYALTRKPQWLYHRINEKVLKGYAILSLLVGIHYIMADLKPGVLFKLPINLIKLAILDNA